MMRNNQFHGYETIEQVVEHLYLLIKYNGQKILCNLNLEHLKALKDCNLIIDATDNFKTRKIINDYCEENKISWLHTGAVKTEVIICLFNGEKKFFSKVFPKEIKDEECCEVGVLASTTFTAASFAYNEVLKFFIGIH